MGFDTVNQERDARAWALRMSGATYTEVGQALGVSKQRAEQICKRMHRVHAPTSEQVEAHRELDLMRLDRILRAVWPDALKGNQGAVDRVLRIQERRAKLLGLDAPSKSEVGGPGGGPVEIAGAKEALAALLARRSNGG